MCIALIPFFCLFFRCLQLRVYSRGPIPFIPLFSGRAYFAVAPFFCLEQVLQDHAVLHRPATQVGAQVGCCFAVMVQNTRCTIVVARRTFITLRYRRVVKFIPLPARVLYCSTCSRAFWISQTIGNCTFHVNDFLGRINTQLAEQWNSQFETRTTMQLPVQS